MASGSELTDDELVTAWSVVVSGLTRVQQDLMDDIERRTGVLAAWFDVIVLLRRAPGHRLPMSALSMELEMSSGGFTKLADRLEQADLIERQPSEEDRRVVYAALTPSGLRTADRAVDIHIANLRSRVIDPLPAGAISSLRETFDGLHRAAATAPDDELDTGAEETG